MLGYVVAVSSQPPAPVRLSTVRVPGKINLALAVGPRRADGFHDLSTLFQAVSLYDDLQATARTDNQITLVMAGEGSEHLACDDTNLAVRAAQLLRERHGRDSLGVDLRVDKCVPMAGGMAGGSADAAGTLLICNEVWGLGLGLEELSDAAAQLGSDVPFLLLGGNALGTGRGERLRPMPEPGRLEWVFAIAQHGLSTPQVYRQFDVMADRGDIVPSAELAVGVLDELCSGEPERVAAGLRNDLQPAALELYPELAGTLAADTDSRVLASLVCGSGPTCAFLCADAESADRLAARLVGLPEVRDTRRAHGPVPGPKVGPAR